SGAAGRVGCRAGRVYFEVRRGACEWVSRSGGDEFSGDDVCGGSGCGGGGVGGVREADGEGAVWVRRLPTVGAGNAPNVGHPTCWRCEWDLAGAAGSALEDD